MASRTPRNTSMARRPLEPVPAQPSMAAQPKAAAASTRKSRALSADDIVLGDGAAAEKFGDASSVASRLSDAASTAVAAGRTRHGSTAAAAAAAGVPNNIAVVVRVRPEPDGRRCGFTGPHPRGGISTDEGGTHLWMAPAEAATDGTGGGASAAARAAGTSSGATARKKFYPEVALGPGASQEDVYVGAVRRLVGAVASGVNASVLGYGATGSGKTYTMVGDLGSPEHRGVIPRALEDLFATLAALREGEGWEWDVKVSFLEVYNENVYDLLAEPDASSAAAAAVADAATAFGAAGAGAAGYAGPGRRARLRLIGEELIMDDVTFLPVAGPADALARLAVGFATRRVGSNTLNAQSSRSHAVLSVYVRGRRIVATGAAGVDDDGAPARVLERRAVLDICDLAGSEQAKKTGAEGDRLREASAINTSLSALSNVVTSLCIRARAPATSNERPRWRDSKLTLLLKRSLGGNCATVFIATLSPATDQWAESLSTLEFVSRARQLKTRPVQNQSEVVGGGGGSGEARARAAEAEAERLRAELAGLSAELAALRGAQPLSFGGDAAAAPIGRVAAAVAAAERSPRPMLDVAALRRALCDAAAALDARLAAAATALAAPRPAAAAPEPPTPDAAPALPGLLAQSFSQLGSAMSSLYEARQWQPIAEALELQLSAARPLMADALGVPALALAPPSASPADGARKRARRPDDGDGGGGGGDGGFATEQPSAASAPALPPRKAARPNVGGWGAARHSAAMQGSSSSVYTVMLAAGAGAAEASSQQTPVADAAVPRRIAAVGDDGDDGGTTDALGLYASTPCIPTPFIRQRGMALPPPPAPADECHEGGSGDSAAQPRRRTLRWQGLSPEGADAAAPPPPRRAAESEPLVRGDAAFVPATASTMAATAVAALRAEWAAEMARRVAHARTEVARDFDAAVVGMASAAAALEADNAALATRLAAAETARAGAAEAVAAMLADAARGIAAASAVDGPGMLRRAAGALALLEEGRAAAEAGEAAARAAAVTAREALSSLQREAALAIFEARVLSQQQQQHRAAAVAPTSDSLAASSPSPDGHGAEPLPAAALRHPPAAATTVALPLPPDALDGAGDAAPLEPHHNQAAAAIPSVPTVMPRAARRHGVAAGMWLAGGSVVHSRVGGAAPAEPFADGDAVQECETQALGGESGELAGEDDAPALASGAASAASPAMGGDIDGEEGDEEEDEDAAPWMALRIARASGGSQGPAAAAAALGPRDAGSRGPGVRGTAAAWPPVQPIRTAPVVNTSFALAFTGRVGSARPAAVVLPAAQGTTDAAPAVAAPRCGGGWDGLDAAPAACAADDDAIDGARDPRRDAQARSDGGDVDASAPPDAAREAPPPPPEALTAGVAGHPPSGSSQPPPRRVDRVKNARFRELISLASAAPATQPQG